MRDFEITTLDQSDIISIKIVKLKINIFERSILWTRNEVENEENYITNEASSLIARNKVRSQHPQDGAETAW